MNIFALFSKINIFTKKKKRVVSYESLYWCNIENRIAIIKNIAEDTGWELLEHQPDNLMLSFTNKNVVLPKNKIRINIYYTTMTVGTCLKNPYKGKTQLFRRKVARDQLRSIFMKPRQHTGKGYYNK